MSRAKATVRERSAGAVVALRSGTEREYLLLKYGSGHWGFPKGHVESGETDIEAAQREVMEETGIPKTSQQVLEGFHQRTDYRFRRGRTLVQKVVDFFLIEVTTRDVQISHEHSEFEWLPFERALARITFEGPKRVLRAAETHLEETPHNPGRAEPAQSG